MATYTETSYCNPTIAAVWPDPALAGPDREGFYWCYATDDEHEPLPRRRFKAARSRDLVSWELNPAGAECGAFPQPIPNYGRYRACWAPDVRRMGSAAWNLYGSLKFDDHQETGPDGHGIFVARSTTPIGFRNPIILKRGPGFTVIDPCFYRSTRLGRNFLFWGSGHAPIKGQELTADGTAFVAGSEPTDILSPDPADPDDRLWEGVHVIEHPTTHDPIVLASKVDTWKGPYRTYAFRGAPHPLDPLRSRPTCLLAENDVWNRCGNAFVLPDAIGQLWIFFHAVRGDAIIPGTEHIDAMGRRGVPLRQMCMERLHFDAAGLPYVNGGSPSSTEQPGPVVLRA
ncbi:family 43 glycosylhydrolase [Falsiroseomonas sp.]|uniref:family 43 glycosylhydrolase n=1 Tax=Falsiroseomonas sp. TaxID=2870721 RepID=UPI00356ADF31